VYYSIQYNVGLMNFLVLFVLGLLLLMVWKGGDHRFKSTGLIGLIGLVLLVVAFSSGGQCGRGSIQPVQFRAPR
jgi:hypothetical protein